jgi:hypothetical protein
MGKFKVEIDTLADNALAVDLLEGLLHDEYAPEFHEIVVRPVRVTLDEEPKPELTKKVDLSKVRGNLFTYRGKWKYAVFLDYSWWNEDDYVVPEEAAKKALRVATELGTSGVSIGNLDDTDYSLVVDSPPNGWPIMVKGKKEQV